MTINEESSSGMRSKLAAKLMSQHGFSYLRDLSGGMFLWRRKGYPVESGIKHLTY